MQRKATSDGTVLQLTLLLCTVVMSNTSKFGAHEGSTILCFNLEGVNVSALELLTHRLREPRNKCQSPGEKQECTKPPHPDCFYCDSIRTRTSLPVSEMISHSPLPSDGHLGCSSRALVSVKQLFLQNRQHKSECRAIHLEDSLLCFLCQEQCLDDCIRKLSELFTTALGTSSQCWFVMGLDVIS